MKLALKLAFRNLIGAGLRTWLNVLVLSFSFVIIIWLKGVMTGWDYQAKTDMTNWDIGDGQFWHSGYDPYDPFTLFDSHAPAPEILQPILERGDIMPKLIVQGTIYPQGRMQSVVINGVNPKQTILKLPTRWLDTVCDAIPVVIGAQMAKSSKLKLGDTFTLQWRDKNGTFDATDAIIVKIFESNVPAAELGQIYVSIERLRSMMSLPNQATVLTVRNATKGQGNIENWIFKSKKELTQQVDEMIKTKSVGQSILYFILLLLAMLAIFDTQVLSIFRRQKEIGTYIALGYTRQQVVKLFTVEGGMHAVFATALATVYGFPFLVWQAKVGWTMPLDTSEFGMAIAQTLYPIYSMGLIVTTTLIVTITTTIVSYIPSRKIAKMNPTDALRGKLQ